MPSIKQVYLEQYAPEKVAQWAAPAKRTADILSGSAQQHAGDVASVATDAVQVQTSQQDRVCNEDVPLKGPTASRRASCSLRSTMCGRMHLGCFLACTASG